MVVIERIKRARTIEESKNIIHGGLIRSYLETEDEFMAGIASLCHTIGEENIISIQFFHDKYNDIDSCIITSKE